nr:MAG: ORF1 [TTV-like mini virus]UGV34205.1 MAG: ORF1 [TTV-like mini virus]UGV34541.1 MAG: ORF1 [TTV-like mini virus]UGV34622.1 MAG: ORF1 [TTV-like mini virus]
MPWYYRRYNRWNYRRPWNRRPRKAFRRRNYRRRRWVRRKFYYKKKLRKINIQQFQPKSIRNCKIKGFLCLYQTTEDRLSYNFDMYEESIIPERLPGGGGFSIKNISLKALYEEHIIAHNIFTKSNNNLPLVRYKGCTLKFYQSKDTDYVVTYSNNLPLRSSMAMYNSMQPSIHLMQQNKIIIPSKQTKHRRKPYTKKFIPPPAQMKSQWYFQHNIANIPLFMLRTSCISLDTYYIGNRQQSTNVTIYTLNTAYIQNRDWGDRTKTWYCQQLGTKKYFLYGTRSPEHDISKIKLQDLIPLTNTQDYQEGFAYSEKAQHGITTYDQYFQNLTSYGNPFHEEWITAQNPVIHMPTSPQQIKLKYTNDTAFAQLTIKNLDSPEYLLVDPVIALRYSPYRDKAQNNKCFFVRSHITAHGWDPEQHQELINDNLPLWLLVFGYPDYIKRTNTFSLVDTNHILVIHSNYTNPKKEPIIPLSHSFVHGYSPYTSATDKHVDPADQHSWYPCYQYQQESLNTICLSGPGTPKIPQGITSEAKVKYTFHFKWGGDLPPMSTVTDPEEQPTYTIPNNFNTTTSLQNPTIHPATFLYSFDERRGQLTDKATKRLLKDWSSKETPLFTTGNRFAEETEIQAPQEESSSEEEEETDLFNLLNRQRAKQQRLKYRIIQTLKQLQNSE